MGLGRTSFTHYVMPICYQDKAKDGVNQSAITKHETMSDTISSSVIRMDTPTIPTDTPTVLSDDVSDIDSMTYAYNN